MTDPREAFLKGTNLEVETISTTKDQLGEFEGEWTARGRNKKFKRRKIAIKFDSCLSFVPSAIQITDVSYTGTTNLQVIRIKNNKFICTVDGNNTGKIAKLDFKWKTIK